MILLTPRYFVLCPYKLSYSFPHLLYSCHTRSHISCALVILVPTSLVFLSYSFPHLLYSFHTRSHSSCALVILVPTPLVLLSYSFAHLLCSCYTRSHISCALVILFPTPLILLSYSFPRLLCSCHTRSHISYSSPSIYFWHTRSHIPCNNTFDVRDAAKTFPIVSHCSKSWGKKKHLGTRGPGLYNADLVN